MIRVQTVMMQHHWHEMCKLSQCEEVANHALPPSDEWAGGEVSANHYVNDWEAGRREKG